jgi:hypothetical protein
VVPVVLMSGDQQPPPGEPLQRQVDQLRDVVEELLAVQQGLEQRAIRTTATLRVVVELVKGI